VGGISGRGWLGWVGEGWGQGVEYSGAGRGGAAGGGAGSMWGRVDRTGSDREVVGGGLDGYGRVGKGGVWGCVVGRRGRHGGVDN